MRIRGAREHNLAGIDLDLPTGALVVLSGVSGSGKSSLAFDTIYRESQRLFLESMSSHARQYLGKLGRPDVDSLQGLRPALAVEQKTIVRSPRSTVGTLSETYDHLRLLFARIGRAHCTSCGESLLTHSPEELAQILEHRYGTETISLLAPIVHDHRGAYRAELEGAREQGVSHARIDGELIALNPTPQLDPALRHTIELVIAKTNARVPSFAGELRQALRYGDNSIRVLHKGEHESFGCAEICHACGAGAPRLGPRLFSFNSPHGACENCKGLGVQDRVAEDLLVADASKTLRTGAMVPTTKSEYIVYSQVTMDVLDEVCHAHGFDVDTPWQKLSEAQRQIIFYGTDKIEVAFGKHPLESRMKWTGITARPRETGFYRGLVPVIEETLKRNRNANILRFVRSEPCTACHGTRLNAAARAVTIDGQTIADFTARTLSDLRDAFDGFAPDTGSPKSREESLAGLILESLRPRIDRLVHLGLGHLTLARQSTSLSGGEAQRIRLATQLGSGLQGLLYVLDEPSIGLHARDQDRLIDTLHALRDQGNDLLVVEHDEATMRAADWLTDIGPRAGAEGGRLLYSGPPSEIDKAPNESLTKRTLLGLDKRELRSPRREGSGVLTISGATKNNLRGDAANLKLSALNVISGVSGAGKSSLITGTLAPTLRQILQRKLPSRPQRDLPPETENPAVVQGIEGAEKIDKLVCIDQKPIGRTPRSNPATYTGVFDTIRTLYAALPTASAAGLGRGDFSTNVKGGRCESCQGAGVQTVGMHGLADVQVPCESCDGRRFGAEVLGVLYAGRSIADVLDLAIDEAIGLFAAEPKITRILERITELGLGYLRLGQPATTLSGGEAQRIKLATELAKPAGKHTLYILDEPTTGLHTADTAVLLQALDRLVDAGHTVVVIEHDMNVLWAADHIVDLGPDSGVRGGRVVAEGTPEALAELDTHTAKALKAHRDDSHRSPTLRLASRRKGGQGGPATAIELRGVTTNNLRDLDVTIPHGSLTVVTGVSGSGKSSLCFDTLFAEGQRRFSECLSNQVRRFLGRTGRAQVREVRGLSPTIAIRQRGRTHGTRSTLGTTTGILELYRLLYSRVGREGETRTSLSLRAFSFLHQQGACPVCEGQGIEERCDPSRLVTQPEFSLLQGAMNGTKTGRFYGESDGQYTATLKQVGEVHDIDFSCPWSELDTLARNIAMHGTGTQSYRVNWEFKRGKRSGEHSFETQWLGFAELVDEEYQRKRTDHRGEAMRSILARETCASCEGTRLAPEARSVRFAGRSLPELCADSIRGAIHWFTSLQGELSSADLALSDAIVQSILERLRTLEDAGLGYLSLERRTHTLSGGEFQRARIAAQLSTSLCGITYVLDEPTQGLHADDIARLIKVLRKLCELGNTVITVEHDRSVIEAADQIIDMGPGAGELGGEIVAVGTPAELRANPNSVTGRYLLQGQSERPSSTRIPKGKILIRGAYCHGIHFADFDLPTGGLCVVSGASGSGKSTLVFDVLATSAKRGMPVNCDSLCGLESFEAIITVDQSAVPQASTSSPATFTGIFDAIRAIYAKTEAARDLGLSKARFSYLSKDSRCETCNGLGHTVTRMDFLPDLRLVCDRCAGLRYEAEVLEVTFRGQSIADLLQMSIEDAICFFAANAKIRSALVTLDELGLGYLRLGQSMDSLSGGETQRLVLARALLNQKTSATLFLLDEPTTGLHFADVETLFRCFDALIERGHSLIVIEHNPDVIARADWNLQPKTLRTELRS